MKMEHRLYGNNTSSSFHYSRLHIQIIWIWRFGYSHDWIARRRVVHHRMGVSIIIIGSMSIIDSPAIGKIAHFRFDILDKGESSASGRKDDRESWTGQESPTTAAIGFSGGPRPEPKGRTGNRRDNGHAVRGVGEKASVWLGCDKDTAGHGGGHATDGHNFVKGHVDFDIANPETQGSIVGDFDAADIIVPKPGQEHQVGDTDGNYSAVGSNGHSGNH